MAEVQFNLEDLKKPHFGADPYIIDGSLKNRKIGDSCTGYSFAIGSLSYRGVWMATLEKIELAIDGEVIDPEDIIVCVNGKKFLSVQLKELFGEYWHPHAPCEIMVYKVGGLAAGEHEIDMTLWRHNDFGYTHEFIATPNRDHRVMTLEA